MAKTILITGASLALVQVWRVNLHKKAITWQFVHDALDRLESLKQELESKYGIKVIPKVLDVTNYDQVFEVFRAFKQEFGHLDRVIVNAGIWRWTSNR